MDEETPIEIDEMDFVQDDMICSVCSAEFLDKTDLEVHIRQIHLNNTNKTRFCQLCSHIFNDIEEYALHLRNTHLGSFKCCKYCTRLFKSTSEVQEHEKRHNAGVLYPKVSCSHCKNVFDSKNEIKNHELKEHSDSNEGLLLRDCLPIFSSLLCMNVHDFLTSLYSNLPYMCVKCDETTADVEAYIQHLVNKKCHSLACDLCCNVFTYKSRLSRHIELHSRFKKDKPDLKMKCSKCKLPFKATKLKSHKKICSGMSCVVCDLTFNTVDEYSKHKLDKHSAKLPVMKVCLYCQRQLFGEESMKKHIRRVHEHEKHLYKYHCTDCKRVFKHPKLLFAHFFSTHKNLKPYTCRICDIKFKVRKGFSLHIKLTHKSVGFVEFDDNFHVYFTDKKSKTQKAVNSDDDQNSEDSIKDEHENAKTKAIKNDNNNDHMLEQSKEGSYELEIEFDPKNVDVDKSNDKQSEIIGVQSVTDEKNADSESKNKNHKSNEDNKEKTADRLLVERRSRKRKLNIVKKHTEHTTEDVDISSDDSDMPLEIVSSKLKLQKKSKKIIKKSRNFFSKNPKSKNFICDKCDRNCYTYQNYHRHRALHFKNETKVCIKCYGKFDSVKKLNEHIKKEHSSSQLTETLKRLLEKRKIEETKAKDAMKSKEIAKSKKITEPEEIVNSDEMNHEVKTCLSKSEKFRNTIKKFKTERTMTTKVTMKSVNKDQVSVKKYLENFMHDNNEVKITMIKNPLSLDTRVKKPKPLIKMTKFTPEPIRESQEVNLKMPVKFTDNLREKFDVQIKLVSEYQPPAMKFYSENDNSFTDEQYVNSYDDIYDTYDATEEVVESKDTIPEVAEEVTMEGTETKKSIVHNIKNLPKWHNVQIAHLAPEAPYFKITKVNLESSSTNAPDNDEGIKQEVTQDLTLPSGKKLVSVNPYEHLLNKNVIVGLKNSKKKYAYKPRISNVAEAIKTALEKLEQPPGSISKKMYVIQKKHKGI